MDELSLSKQVNQNVAIVAFPWISHTPYKFLAEMVKIIEPISDKIILIDGNTDRIDITSDKVVVRDIGVSMHYRKDIKQPLYSAILWIAKCVLAQIFTSIELVKTRKEVDVVIFYMAYPYYLLPLIISKILKKKTVEVITRSKQSSIIPKIIGLQDAILFNLLDGISPESNALIRDLCLEKYADKILPEGSRFIDFSRYTIKKKSFERKNIVGFIGRINEEKGIEQFIKAIPLVIREYKNIEFLIGGSGDLLDTIKDKCNEIEQTYNVKIAVTGFIKEEELPIYLSELKLLILPTQHAEGLPTIILEAMSCGTLVLATSVGGIKDIVKDAETGFILENNSPQCIKENIIRILAQPNNDIIVKNAKNLMFDKYSYRVAVERYRKIINFTSSR